MSDRKKKRLARQRFEVLPGEGKRFSFSNFKQAALFYVLLLLALVVIVQLGYHWLGEQFLAWRLQVIEARPGEMNQEVTVLGYITRHEEVIYAPANVVILSLAPDGQRVASGDELARLGIIPAGDLPALQGTEEEEPDLALLDQLLDYWDTLFNKHEESPAEEDEHAAAGPIDHSARDEEESENDLATEAVPESSLRDAIIIYCDEPGLVSYYTDGLEDEAGPLYLVVTTEEDFEEENEQKEPEQAEEEISASFEQATLPVIDGKLAEPGQLVEAGEPLLKIVDNWHWYYSLVLPLHPGRSLAELQQLEISFSFASDYPVQARLLESEIDEEARQVRLFYRIDSQLPGFERERLTESTLLYRRQSGIIVPSEALLEKEEKTGLFINQGGRVVFKPVSVIDRQDDQVLVEGLDPFSMVISRPDLVEEGQRFR